MPAIAVPVQNSTADEVADYFTEQAVPDAPILASLVVSLGLAPADYLDANNDVDVSYLLEVLADIARDKFYV